VAVSRAWPAVVLLAAAVVLSGCSGPDQLRAKNDRLERQFKLAQGRIAEMEGREAERRAELNAREKEVQLAQAEAELWKKKHDVLQEAIREMGSGPAISPELESQLRRLALVDPNIRVKQTEEGFVVEVGTDILFDSGKIDLNPEGRATIKKIADVIKKVGGEEVLRIDGHTDNVPIRYSGWKDNWQLSVMRAHTVLKALQAEGIPPERTYLAGFAFYRPEASNDTPQGRRQNRRVEILIIPQLAVVPIEAE